MEPQQADDEVDGIADPEDSPTEREATVRDGLKWIGFTLPEQTTLLDQFGTDLKTFVTMDERDLDRLDKYLGSVKPISERVLVGFKRLGLLKGLIHWAKDKKRIGMAVNVTIKLDDPTKARVKFMEELNESMVRQSIRILTTDAQLDTRSKAASPGKLKDEKNWDKWEQALVLMLSILRGVSGVPLSYVIREQDGEIGGVYNSFLDQSIACVSLVGPHFEADARVVHEIIETLTNSENAAHWLKDIKKKNDGRKDMVALRSHYRGAGNQSRRIANAQGLHATLHYKNERAMKFADFISKAKEMFDIYEDCNEPQKESVKLRFLWEKIDSATLQMPMEIMKADLSRDENSWSFVSACDHLSSLTIPSGKAKVSFQTSAIEKKGGAKSNVMKDGELFTGSYSPTEWFQVLTRDERDQVQAARSKEGKPHYGKKKDKRTPKTDRKVQALEKKLKKSKKTISALKREAKAEAEEEDDDSDEADESDEGGNAGTKFGGRSEKKRQKKKPKK